MQFKLSWDHHLIVTIEVKLSKVICSSNAEQMNFLKAVELECQCFNHASTHPELFTSNYVAYRELCCYFSKKAILAFFHLVGNNGWILQIYCEEIRLDYLVKKSSLLLSVMGKEMRWMR